MPPSDDPTAINYWRREALIYESDRLATLSGALRAPRFYGRDERADGTLWLWLEDLGEGDDRW